GRERLCRSFGYRNAEAICRRGHSPCALQRGQSSSHRSRRGTHVTYMTTKAEAQPHLAKNGLRIIGVASPQQEPSVSGVPTIIEQGVADYVASFWYGLTGPAGMPDPVLTTLNQALAKTLADADVRARLDSLGMTPWASSAPEFG